MNTFQLEDFSLEMESLWASPPGIKLPSSAHDRSIRAHEELQQKFRAGTIGFFDWPATVDASELSRMQKVAESLKKKSAGTLIFGIGGSHLGGAAILDAFYGLKDQTAFPIHWVNQIDPDSMREAEFFLSNKKMSAVLISKSGDTLETLASFAHLSKHVDPSRIVVITDPKAGTLRMLAQAENWENFDVPPNIGGRYSVLTPVGLFPASLAGIDPQSLLEGARSVRSYLQGLTPNANPAYLFAWALYLWDTEHAHSLQYLMPYQKNLYSLAQWYVQLWGESLGKKAQQGPTPIAALGSSDQHSLLQLFREGPKNKVIGFVDILHEGKRTLVEPGPFKLTGHEYLLSHSFETISHRACLSVIQSLKNSNVPTYRFEVPQLTPRAMGALFFFFEIACAFAGELYQINAFDQPGVEEAKTLWKASLKT